MVKEKLKDKDGDEINPVTLTFSKKNEDVYYILKEIAKDGTKKTEYICNAVRAAYRKELNINERADNQLNNVENIIESILEKKLGQFLNDKTIIVPDKNELMDISNISSQDLDEE